MPQNAHSRWPDGHAGTLVEHVHTITEDADGDLVVDGDRRVGGDDDSDGAV